jgi:hypothetical protein
MIQPACARRLITHFGFLGRWRFDRENPRFWGLEKLGFPWILSSESRLINGLRWIFAGEKFLSPFCPDGGGGTGDIEGEVMRRSRIIHERSLV